MRSKPCTELEKGRVLRGKLASDATWGNNGAFVVATPWGTMLQLIVSNGGGWEHVSATRHDRKKMPTWDEMNWVKDLVWDAEETVVQYHPAKSQYVNNHPFVLHLWKPREVEIPLPPIEFVGIKGVKIL
jgi:hypothetical protein